MARPIIRNWRQLTPHVGHDNAIVWNIMRPETAKARPAQPALDESVPEAERTANCLKAISGVARHMLQAGKSSNYHAHQDAEQLYYIVRGRGTMIVDGERYPVREGDTVYLPAGCMHRAVNDSDDWMEHLIITARIQANGGS